MKLVFLYDKEIHGEETDKGEINRDVFEAGLKCSSKTMYPDWLSLSGEGYVPSMYKKYKRVVSPMGRQQKTAHVKLGELLHNRCTFYILIIDRFALTC